MIRDVVVQKVIPSRTDYWMPHIVAENGKCAGIPKMFLEDIKVGDTVSVLHDEDMNCGGFGAVVIGIKK